MYLYSRQTPGAMGMALLANSKAEGRHVLPYLGPGIAVIESYDGADHLTLSCRPPPALPKPRYFATVR